MLYFDRTDVSEGADTNETSASKKSVIFVTTGIF